jgi:hypothetical protein
MNAFDIPQVRKLFDLVVDPLVRLIFAAAIAYFAWGVFVYIRKSDDSSERQTGGRHVFWSTVGIFIMLSVWGIIELIKNTLGVR